MIERRFHKNKSRFSKTQIIIAASSIILILLVVGIIKEKINRRQINKEVERLQNQVKVSERDNLEISALIEEWRQGSRIEKEARLKLGLKKPGETVVMIMRQPSSTAENTFINQNAEIVGNIIKSKESDNIINPLKWWRYFFKN